MDSTEASRVESDLSAAMNPENPDLLTLKPESTNNGEDLAKPLTDASENLANVDEDLNGSEEPAAIPNNSEDQLPNDGDLEDAFGDSFNDDEDDEDDTVNVIIKPTTKGIYKSGTTFQARSQPAAGQGDFRTHSKCHMFIIIYSDWSFDYRHKIPATGR